MHLSSGRGGLEQLEQERQQAGQRNAGRIRFHVLINCAQQGAKDAVGRVAAALVASLQRKERKSANNKRERKKKWYKARKSLFCGSELLRSSRQKGDRFSARLDSHLSKERVVTKTNNNNNNKSILRYLQCTIGAL